MPIRRTLPLINESRDPGRVSTAIWVKLAIVAIAGLLFRNLSQASYFKRETLLCTIHIYFGNLSSVP